MSTTAHFIGGGPLDRQTFDLDGRPQTYSADAWEYPAPTYGDDVRPTDVVAPKRVVRHVYRRQSVGARHGHAFYAYEGEEQTTPQALDG